MAGPDLSIYSQFMAPPKSVADFTDEADAREAKRMALVLQQGSLADKEEARQRQRNLLSQLQGLGATATDDDRLRVYRNNGAFDQADALEKARIERVKAQADVTDKASQAAKRDQEAAANAYGAVRTFFSSLRGRNDVTPDTVSNGLQALAASGVVKPHVAEFFIKSTPQDPAAILASADRFAKEGLTPEQQFTLFAAKPTAVNDGKTQRFVDTNALSPSYGQQTAGGTVQMQTTPGEDLSSADRAKALAQQAADAAAGRSVTMRGQNMTDARAREQIAQGKVQYDAERGGVVDLKTGAFTPVTDSAGKPVGAKDKPLTETQSKDLLFGSRMRAANQIVERLAAKGTTANVSGMDAPYVGRAITALTSTQQQQLNQAKRDWINAVLRKESGAVIGADEFDSADRQYFPQIGEPKEVIEQKRQNRLLAEQGVLSGVPEGRRDSLAVPAAPAASPALVPQPGRGGPIQPKPVIKPGAVLKFDAQGNLIP